MWSRVSALAALFGLAACSAADSSPPPIDASSDGTPVDTGPRPPKPGDPCSKRADCDDGIFCSGVEECLAGVCVSARNAPCRASCGDVSCIERLSACAIIPRSCGGSLSCSIERGCVEEPPCDRDGDPRCDDGRACTDDICVGGRCAHLPVDSRCPAVSACGVGVCLGEAVAAESGCGARPDAARCGANEGCGLDFGCAPLAAACTRDRDCSNGNLCDGIERCVDGRCAHGEATTCQPEKTCQHASCSTAGVGDPWCLIVGLARCP